MDKLSDFLCLLMEQHLWRLETEPGFSAIEFLSLLFQLTIHLSSLSCYLRCLSVWVAFFKQIKPQNAYRYWSFNLRWFLLGYFWFNRYSEALQSLITAILNKMQFSYNFEQLSSINDEDLDEDVSFFSFYFVVLVKAGILHNKKIL